MKVPEKKFMTVDEFTKAVHDLNFDCVDIATLYDLLHEQQHIISNGEHLTMNGVVDPIFTTDKDHIKKIFKFLMTSKAFDAKLEYSDHARGTFTEGHIMCKDNEDSSVVVSLFVNGNNGTTIVSKESLRPIMEYIEYIERLGGKAFISGVSYHSDVYYYAVTSIFWK